MKKLSRREFCRLAAPRALRAAAAVSRAPAVFAAPPDSPNDRLQLGIIGVGPGPVRPPGSGDGGARGRGRGVCGAYKGRVRSGPSRQQ